MCQINNESELLKVVMKIVVKHQNGRKTQGSALMHFSNLNEKMVHLYQVYSRGRWTACLFLDFDFLVGRA